MKTALTIAGVVAALIVLPVGCSIVSTVQTAATAPGRVINKTLQTDNIIFRYERFFALNSEYQSRTAQIAQGKTALAAEVDPAEKSRLRVDLGAQQQSCRDLANNYNADAAKLNAKLFRDKNLPTSLDAAVCE